MARLHIYPHAEPQQDLYIIAEPRALKALADAMIKTAQMPRSFQRVKLHTSDGHEYTAMIMADVSEEEWQTVAPAYKGAATPNISVLENYEELLLELNQKHTKDSK